MLSCFEVQKSRQALADWERNLASNVLVQTRAWHDERLAYVTMMHEEQANLAQDPELQCDGYAFRPLSYELHCIRGDATNTAV
eukprot:15032444-Alexandrium_andersonii.AAC.1